ncbi:jg226, partial [Pararge aegeria aegeria]
HDQYVEFTHSDFDADAAQSTVPFIDIQPLEPIKGTALISGAGIIHRGAHGTGGFIAAKLFTYDYSRHVKAESPPPIVDIEAEEELVLPANRF